MPMLPNMKCECGAEFYTSRMRKYDLYPCLNCGRLYDVNAQPTLVHSPPNVAGGENRTEALRSSLLQIKAIRSKQRAAMELSKQLELRVRHELCESRVILDGERRQDVYSEVFGL